MRTCAACRKKAPQQSLLRLALTADGVFPDPERLIPGRGAYVCPNRQCIGRLGGLRNRASLFKRPIDDEAWAELMTRLAAYGQAEGENSRRF